MAFWFIRGLRNGVVTTRYPGSNDSLGLSLPTPPAFHTDGLDRQLAARLVQVCPNGSLRLEGPELVVDLGLCTACGRCMAAAPAVVHPSGAWELASADRRSLRKKISLKGAEQQ